MISKRLLYSGQRYFSKKPLNGSIAAGQLRISDIYKVVAIRHAQSTFNLGCSSLEAEVEKGNAKQEDVDKYMSTPD